MSISFQCDGCGKRLSVPDELAGKVVKCKQCGQRGTIPSPSRDPAPSAFDPYALDEPAPARRPARTEDDVLPPRAGPAVPSPTRWGSTPSKAKGDEPSGAAKILRGIGIGAIILLGLSLRVYNAYNRSQNRARANESPTAASTALAVKEIAGDRNGPIKLPSPLPDPGPGREIAPGITLHEIRLPGGAGPGQWGKLWLYLPTGEHAPKSLPCVMITGAGSNLITGMELGDSDRPEHLPYVRAGFAVLAYELDGMLQNREHPNDAELNLCMAKFLAARAGLVNAHIAIEYLLAKVPQVDPDRIYTAGHSSAGTMAMLFAENEPRLKACVAFAPAIDLVQRFGAQGVQVLTRSGFGDFFTRYSPKDNETNLHCPIMLFHARDDSNVPVALTEASAARLRQLGKSVTLEIVPTGEHYDSMIQEGIPRAIAWLQEKAGLPVTYVSAEPAPQPNPVASPPPGFNPALPPPGIQPPRFPFPHRPRGPRMGPMGPRGPRFPQ